MPPLVLAASYGHLETVKYLHNHERTNRSLADNHGCDALFHALRSENHVRLFSYLCGSYTHGELTEMVDLGSRTLLNHASYFDRMEAFSFLLSINDDVNHVDLRGRNALHWAVYNDNAEMIRKLIERGCKTDQMDCHGRAPLSIAALLGKPNAVELLFPISDDKTKDNDGNYLIHMAVHSGNLDTVRILLDSGVNINKYNDQGEYFFFCFTAYLLSNTHLSDSFKVHPGGPRDHFLYAPSQWEMALQCNAISQWLGTYTEWSLWPRDAIYVRQLSIGLGFWPGGIKP